MLVAIKDSSGRPIAESLGPEIAHGGEGVVYTLANPQLANRCVKIYHDHKLESLDARGHEQKLNAMVARQEYADSSHLAWPRRIIYNESGTRWLGYVMPRAQGFPLDQLCHLQRVRERYSSWRRSDFCRVTLSVIEAFSFVHSLGDLVGDVNPRNILVDPATMAVTLLDCDSMHFTDRGVLYPCTVALPAYVAPELQVSTSPNSSRDQFSERFSVAVLLAMLWMLGKHPFSCIVPDHEDPSNYGDAANILHGRCPLAVGSSHGLPPGPWGHLWSQLPSYLQSLFVQTFKTALNEPARRVDLDTWFGGFTRYLRSLESGEAEDNTLVGNLPQGAMLPPPLPKDRGSLTVANVDADARAYEFDGRLIGANNARTPPGPMGHTAPQMPTPQAPYPTYTAVNSNQLSAVTRTSNGLSVLFLVTMSFFGIAFAQRWGAGVIATWVILQAAFFFSMVIGDINAARAYRQNPHYNPAAISETARWELQIDALLLGMMAFAHGRYIGALILIVALSTLSYLRIFRKSR